MSELVKNVQTWPGGVVPYKMPDWRHKITAWNIRWALSSLSEATGGCVRFREATDDDKDFVVLTYGDGCSSHIGRIGGPQPLSLGFGCELHAYIYHGFMHALGFFHEHARQDRDENIEVRWKNVETSACGSFAKYVPASPLPYDLNSAMQLSSFAFSCKLGKSSMWDRHGGKLGGDLGGIFYPNTLTKLDVKKIRRLYGC